MKKNKRRWGDRSGARRIRNIGGMTQICIDLKPRRSLSELYINQKVDVTKLVEYINKSKEEGKQKITYFHAFSMAIAKTIYNRPLLNRFVANRHVYEHNDVSLSFVMKVEFNDKSEEIMVIMPVLENDNIFTLSDKIAKKVDDVRTKSDRGSGANDAIHLLGKLPNIIRIPVVGLFKYFDKIGMLPRSLVKDNLYYSSILVSNIGSLKCGGIYHNLTDFGECSGLITIGEIKEEIVGKNKKYFCEFGVTMDERLGDGYYYIKSIKLIEYILNNPELLEGNANDKITVEL